MLENAGTPLLITRMGAGWPPPTGGGAAVVVVVLGLVVVVVGLVVVVVGFIVVVVVVVVGLVVVVLSVVVVGGGTVAPASSMTAMPYPGNDTVTEVAAGCWLTGPVRGLVAASIRRTETDDAWVPGTLTVTEAARPAPPTAVGELACRLTTSTAVLPLARRTARLSTPGVLEVDARIVDPGGNAWARTRSRQ